MLVGMKIRIVRASQLTINIGNMFAKYSSGVFRRLKKPTRQLSRTQFMFCDVNNNVTTKVKSKNTEAPIQDFL